MAEESDTLFSKRELETIINRATRPSGLGSTTRAFQELMYGIDMLPGKGQPLQKNRDDQGLVFFTRPLLNLSYDNLITDRRLSPLITRNPNSYQWMVRSVLDPWRAKAQPLESPFVDKENAFIPILSNTLMSMPSWQDVVGDVYTASEGAGKESWAMFDGFEYMRNTWDLNLTFRCVAGDPVSLLFYTWICYGLGVYTGTLIPYPAALRGNWLDYQTAIWRLPLSGDGKYVTNIAKTIAFPYALSLGAKFAYQQENVFNTETDTISVPFKCIGAEYNDPILILEFNKTVAYDNPLMEDPASTMIRLHPDEYSIFNRFCYPHIEDDMRLHRYVHPSIYKVLLDEGQQAASLLADQSEVA